MTKKNLLKREIRTIKNNQMKVLQLKIYINFLNWLNNIFEITGNGSKLAIKI